MLTNITSPTSPYAQTSYVRSSQQTTNESSGANSFEQVLTEASKDSSVPSETTNEVQNTASSLPSETQPNSVQPEVSPEAPAEGTPASPPSETQNNSIEPEASSENPADAASVQEQQKPSIAQFMALTGSDFYTASDALYKYENWKDYISDGAYIDLSEAQHQLAHEVENKTRTMNNGTYGFRSDYAEPEHPVRNTGGYVDAIYQEDGSFSTIALKNSDNEIISSLNTQSNETVKKDITGFGYSTEILDDFSNKNFGVDFDKTTIQDIVNTLKNRNQDTTVSTKNESSVEENTNTENKQNITQTDKTTQSLTEDKKEELATEILSNVKSRLISEDISTSPLWKIMMGISELQPSQSEPA